MSSSVYQANSSAVARDASPFICTCFADASSGMHTLAASQAYIAAMHSQLTADLDPSVALQQRPLQVCCLTAVPAAILEVIGQ